MDAPTSHRVTSEASVFLLHWGKKKIVKQNLLIKKKIAKP